MSVPPSRSTQWQWLALALTLGLIALTAFLAPEERSLGANLRLIMVHGAWVWVGKIVFGAAALAGAAGLLLRRPEMHRWSQALAHTGLTFWLTYLPMALLVMQLTWGGLYLDEPRWRVPFTFGVVGLLLQVGLWLASVPWLSSAANVGFGAALWWSLGGLQNILHPDAPIAQSDSTRIQFFFILLLVLTLVLAVQVAFLWRQAARKRTP